MGKPGRHPRLPFDPRTPCQAPRIGDETRPDCTGNPSLVKALGITHAGKEPSMYVECLFENSRVELGGQQHEGCTFKNCEMVFDGRPVHLTGCVFDGVRWSF